MNIYYFILFYKKPINTIKIIVSFNNLNNIH